MFIDLLKYLFRVSIDCQNVKRSGIIIFKYLYLWQEYLGIL